MTEPTTRPANVNAREWPVIATHQLPGGWFGEKPIRR